MDIETISRQLRQLDQQLKRKVDEIATGQQKLSRLTTDIVGLESTRARLMRNLYLGIEELADELDDVTEELENVKRE